MEPNFAARVRGQAAAHGDARFVYLREVGRELTEDVATYRELDRDARAIAVWLSNQPGANRPVALLYDTGLDFLRAFLGCLYAGVIAIPAPLPVQANGMRRVAGIFADAAVGLVLTSSTIRDLLDNGLRSAGIESVSVAATDVIAAPADSWTMPDIDSDTVAFLQYTSGSTGTPKGVVVTHGNLLHNTAAIQRAFGLGTRPTAVGWIPHFHDMGLIGLLLGALHSGSDCIYMSPVTFLKRPVRLLQAIDKYRGNITAATNFAYELIARRITPEQVATLDLSCLHVALNGAEPVRHHTLDALVERLGPAGFRPSAVVPTYGLAEVTLLAAGAHTGTSPRRLHVDPTALERNTVTPATGPGITLVSSGPPAAGLDIRVVEPETLRTLGENIVGEIWIRGPSVTAGYWNRPEQTRQDFRSELDGDGPFLRTGDLGFLSGGELFVTGRLKDLIIVNGRNLYPHDIESAVCETHAALSDSINVAVSLEADDKERLVLIVGLRDAAVELDSLATTIRTAVAQTFDVPAPSVVLTDHRAVQRTTSGKVQRRAMKAAFLDRSIDRVRYEIVEPTVARLRVE